MSHATTGSLQQTLEGHCQEVLSVTLSHDSKLIASASKDDQIKVWDMVTGSLQQTIEGDDQVVDPAIIRRGPCCVAFSPNSKFLASGSHVTGWKHRWPDHSDEIRNKKWDYCAIKIWDTTTWALQQTLQGHGSNVESIAFSHDSKHIASNSGSAIEIWDTTTWKLQQTLEGHSGSVTSVAFSPNSKLSASGSYDSTIKIRDATAWTLQQTLKGHMKFVMSVAFSYNSNLIVSISGDGDVGIWYVTGRSLLQILKVGAGGILAVLSGQ